MSGEMYELVALGMRYFFAAIMVLIVARAWKISVVDSRRAKKLRQLAPETGLCGEFLVVAGDGRRAREGMRYPVIREGLVGSSRKADVRVKSPSVRRAHAFFDQTDAGLRVRAQGRARMYDGAGMLRRETVLGDGDRVRFGKVEMMLVLTDGQAAPGRDPRANLFDVAPEPTARGRARGPSLEDELFGAPDRRPEARREPSASGRARGSSAEDETFDVRDRRSDAQREPLASGWSRMSSTQDEAFDVPDRRSDARREPPDHRQARGPSTQDETFDVPDRRSDVRRESPASGRARGPSAEDEAFDVPDRRPDARREPSASGRARVSSAEDEAFDVPDRRSDARREPLASGWARGPSTQDEAFDVRDRRPDARRESSAFGRSRVSSTQNETFDVPDRRSDARREPPARGRTGDGAFDGRRVPPLFASAEPDEVYDSWDEASSARRERADGDAPFKARENRPAPGERRESGESDGDPFDI